ncbi:stage V sporulation protein AD [Vallitalea okinawensis]|uniref:stage V sporulation protein AD n=1 Tax=Vallitalea okinawensis TaxID=2078660 RepID=UPI000CFAA1F8|nr:stage V sporulation protein AD [Vallitalea okinawensis]
MDQYIGKQSIKFTNPPSILGAGSIVGPKEGKGPLRDYFDQVLQDDLWGEDTWEKAETKLVKESMKLALKHANKTIEDIRYIFAGDLLNQLVATTFAIREFNTPFFGLYGACSTMGESIQLASMAISGGFADYTLAATSSHFCGAEKQFRFPLEYGSQRPLTATWTVTGSGAVVLGKQGQGPFVTAITTGKIVDLGITDPMNMGAAMAPAAADTLVQHFKDLGTSPDDYDLIITGDLGSIGNQLMKELVEKEGYYLHQGFTDCGIEIFDANTQDTHAGGSGCGCSAVTLTGYLLQEMKNDKYKSILFIPTGALLSTLSTQQGESIPGIAHAVVIQKYKG